MLQWWTPEQSSTILGYAGSAVGLCWALVGVGTVLAEKGKARRFVLGMSGVVTALGAVAGCVGLAAVLLGQPAHVAQPLALGGGMVAVLGVVIGLVSHKKFAQSEQRRLDAAALRQG